MGESMGSWSEADSAQTDGQFGAASDGLEGRSAISELSPGAVAGKVEQSGSEQDTVGPAGDGVCWLGREGGVGSRRNVGATQWGAHSLQRIVPRCGTFEQKAGGTQLRVAVGEHDALGRDTLQWTAVGSAVLERTGNLEQDRREARATPQDQD